MSEELQARHRATTSKLLLVVALMFGFAYALVPLYDVICDITGLNGKTSNRAASAATEVDADRTIRVSFVTRRGGDIPWAFEPRERSVRVHPGEITLVNFHVRNDGDDMVIAQAIPSVSPAQAAPHLKKTQCFCFEQQSLMAGGEMDMPMIFYLDPALPAHVEEVTLSYTLYDITERVRKQNSDVAVLADDDNRI